MLLTVFLFPEWLTFFICRALSFVSRSSFRSGISSFGGGTRAGSTTAGYSLYLQLVLKRASRRSYSLRVIRLPGALLTKRCRRRSEKMSRTPCKSCHDLTCFLALNNSKSSHGRYCCCVAFIFSGKEWSEFWQFVFLILI